MNSAAGQQEYKVALNKLRSGRPIDEILGGLWNLRKGGYEAPYKREGGYEAPNKLERKTEQTKKITEKIEHGNSAESK